jgi:hypothetical protein
MKDVILRAYFGYDRHGGLCTYFLYRLTSSGRSSVLLSVDESTASFSDRRSPSPHHCTHPSAAAARPTLRRFNSLARRPACWPPCECGGDERRRRSLSPLLVTAEAVAATTATLRRQFSQSTFELPVSVRVLLPSHGRRGTIKTPIPKCRLYWCVFGLGWGVAIL